MKTIILRRYTQLLQQDMKDITPIIQEDTERADRAIKEVYSMFREEIEGDMIESILVLTAAYILEEQI